MAMTGNSPACGKKHLKCGAFYVSNFALIKAAVFFSIRRPSWCH
jgi:hypothetical protein